MKNYITMMILNAAKQRVPAIDAPAQAAFALM